MSVCAVVYLEDASRVGVWPSHLDGLRAVCSAYGIDELHYIDKHIDGYVQEFPGPPVAQKRYASFEDWSADNTGLVALLETEATIVAHGQTPLSLLAYTHPTDVHYLIGASNGHDAGAWDVADSFLYLPQGQVVGLESRDAFTIVVAHRYLQSLG